ncbi:hypothetical protein PLEOSDRAFT_164090 [Pleurotus ostreatus PC15]|uniref:Uncharacterized protein n=1 Tax=Pleurotus ostreatus (strain PC15) TaxID=1137138 RepID=A0A067P0W1_PLEO1|nr:hypothetical protein PLEOSDRAFT_164090 [Pleurotus ostreatus PC15]
MAIHGSSWGAHRTNFEILGVFSRDFDGWMSYQRKGRRTPEEGKVAAGNSTRLPGQFSTELAVGIHLSASVGTRVEIGSERKKQVTGSQGISLVLQFWHLVEGRETLGDRCKGTIAEVEYVGGIDRWLQWDTDVRNVSMIRRSWGVHRKISSFWPCLGLHGSKWMRLGVESMIMNRKAPGVRVMVSYGPCRGHESPDSEAWGGMPAANEDTLLMQDGVKKNPSSCCMYLVVPARSCAKAMDNDVDVHRAPVCPPTGCNTDSHKEMGHTTGSLTALIHMYHPPECSISGIHFNLNHGHLLLLVPIFLHPIQIARSPSFSVLPSVLMPDTLENAVPDNSAPVSYIMRVILAEIDPSPTWVVISSLLLLFISPFTLNSSNYMFLLSTPVRLCVNFSSTSKQLDYQTDHDTNTGLYRLFANSSGIRSSYVLQFDSHFSAPVNVRSETDARMWDHDGNGSWHRRTDSLSGLDGLNPDPGLDKNQAHLGRRLRYNPQVVRGPSTGMTKPSRSVSVGCMNMSMKLDGNEGTGQHDSHQTSPTSVLNHSLRDRAIVCNTKSTLLQTSDRLFSTLSPSVADHGIHIPLTSFHRDLVDDASSATNGWIATRRNLQSRQWGLGLPDWLLPADGHDRRRLEMLLRGQWVAHDIWVADYRVISRTTMGAQSQKDLEVLSKPPRTATCTGRARLSTSLPTQPPQSHLQHPR